MSRFLITGGSGFLGINLVRHLLARDHKITVLDISPFDYPDVKAEVRALQGDIRRRSDVEEAMEGVDLVVHAAAALPLYKTQDIISTDVDGTRLVLETAYQYGVQRFVHISSTAVYGTPDHHPLLEDDPLVGVGTYGWAKIAAEVVCVEYRGKGLCVPIIRPKSFVGPERLGVFALLYDWAREGHGFPMLGSGQNRYQLLDVEDLCEAIYLTTTLEMGKVNDTFNVGASDFTTMGEDYQAVLDAAGFGKKVRPFPAAPAILALRLLDTLRLSPLYRWVYETASKDSLVSIKKAQNVLGFRPRYSNKDALLRNYRWYLENLESFRGVSGISHRAVWKQGILALAKRFF